MLEHRLKSHNFSALKNVFIDLVPLLTISLCEGDIVNQKIKLQNSLEIFYQYLEYYRRHEARENLIHQLHAELVALDMVEDEILG